MNLDPKTAELAINGIDLVIELSTAITKLVSMPGFGTPQGISDADLATLRLGEGIEQRKLAAVIAAMPDA